MFTRSHNNSQWYMLGVALAVVAAPVAAQETVVEGVLQRDSAYTERVPYTDLDLRDAPAQQMLVTRVKQAGGRVCRAAYKRASIQDQIDNDCRSRSYRDAKPQISLAIANAMNGRQVAMNLVVSAGR